MRSLVLTNYGAPIVRLFVWINDSLRNMMTLGCYSWFPAPRLTLSTGQCCVFWELISRHSRFRTISVPIVHFDDN
jgi:hypothetical protein